MNCRPEDTPSDKINVPDSDDEFIITKPDIKDQANYDKFLDELYQHDEAKKPKTKRDAEEKVGEKLTVELPEEFDVPVKPVAHEDEHYDQFLTHLYRHDELKRSKRMIVFRHV